MKKSKRILAILAVIFLLSLPLITLIAAITSTPATAGLFKVALFSTIMIPILLYIFQLFIKLKNIKNNKEDNNK